MAEQVEVVRRLAPQMSLAEVADSSSGCLSLASGVQRCGQPSSKCITSFRGLRVTTTAMRISSRCAVTITMIAIEFSLAEPIPHRSERSPVMPDEPQVDPVTGEEVIDLEAAKKDELQEEAEARGLDTSGTKAELADRIVEADESGGTSFNYGPEAAEAEEYVSAEDAPGGKSFSYGPEAVTEE